MIEPLLVGIGGAIGAVLRHVVGTSFQESRFPVATFSVNVLGSFVLGLVTFASVTDEMLLFVGVGACGAFTTYSTFSVETIQRWDGGEQVQAVLYAGGTLLACMIAALLAAGLVSLI